MTHCFAPGASRLAGVAGWMLGWRPDEFWRATPQELLSVLRAGERAAAGGEDGAAGAAGVDGADLARMLAAMPD